jgi:hypothetical protein
MTTLATKRALIGQHLINVEKHHTEAVKLLSTIDDDRVRTAMKQVYLASYHCEEARVKVAIL